MKLSPSLFAAIPKHLGHGLCVFGKPSDEVAAWCAHHRLSMTPSGAYANIAIPAGVSVTDLFTQPTPYPYVDGFSPNLNKHLHLGHLSNLVYAKAFQALGVGQSFVALLGDTIQGKVSHDEATAAFNAWCGLIGYEVDAVYLASHLSVDCPVAGTGLYEGTKGFDALSYVVGIKSNGETSYLYHDVALAAQLNAPTLYLTGMEQTDHFKHLAALFPHIKHVPLGLVQMDGAKMSSSDGNVVMLQPLWDELTALFAPPLAWNVLAGPILKAHPQSAKKVTLDSLKHVKSSPGLYLSYTLARLKSAGIQLAGQPSLDAFDLAFAHLVAKHNLNPAALMTALTSHAQAINSLYVDHTIKDNPANQAMFKAMGDDLLTGMLALGLMDVDKV